MLLVMPNLEYSTSDIAMFSIFIYKIIKHKILSFNGYDDEFHATPSTHAIALCSICFSRHGWRCYHYFMKFASIPQAELTLEFCFAKLLEIVTSSFGYTQNCKVKRHALHTNFKIKNWQGCQFFITVPPLPLTTDTPSN